MVEQGLPHLAFSFVRRMRETDKSSAFIKKLSDEIIQVYYNDGLTYLQKRKKTEALKCIDEMKTVDPESPLIQKLMDKIKKGK